MSVLLDSEEERHKIIQVINHLEGLLRATTDPTEIADYTRQIVSWRQRLAELANNLTG